MQCFKIEEKGHRQDSDYVQNSRIEVTRIFIVCSCSEQSIDFFFRNYIKNILGALEANDRKCSLEVYTVEGFKEHLKKKILGKLK